MFHTDLNIKKGDKNQKGKNVKKNIKLEQNVCKTVQIAASLTTRARLPNCAQIFAIAHSRSHSVHFTGAMLADPSPNRN